ncbi:MAG TPA: hypothetical protein VFJ51_13525 [Nitrososphaeraceae archaeon]|nr:hypothetical protein [Nitrososphaeraceae archaeon]
MAAADDYLESFCKQILNRDYFIRSARIADRVGHLVAVAYRRELTPLLTSEESSRAAAQAAIRAATRDRFKSKIGEIQYSISRYTELVRATVPIKDGTKNSRFLLLLTFDIDAEADSIILKKIIPYLEENKDYFL